MYESPGWIWSKLAECFLRILPELTDQPDPNPNQDSAEKVEDVCQDYVHMDGGHQCFNLTLQDFGKVSI
jgi:hypothetical protein